MACKTTKNRTPTLRVCFHLSAFTGKISKRGTLMGETQIRFEDGAAYERNMGNWSQRAGSIFLDWLAAASDLKWIDVGCGNGAFTELLVERCAPVEVQGIDPSEGQLAFARTRPAARIAKFSRGDAMALPYRNECDGTYGSKPAAPRSIADRGATRVVDPRRPRCGRNAGDSSGKSIR